MDQPSSLNSTTPPGAPQLSSGRDRFAFKIIMTLLPFVVVGVGFLCFWWPEYQQDQLRKTGIATTGTILSIEPTGTVYNDQPQVKITVNVQLADGSSYTAQTRMIINQVYLPQFQPGTLVHVHYDATDRSRVAID